MTSLNPLLQPFTNKDQTVPFDQIKTEHYIPALNSAIAEAQERFKQIKQNKDTTFENTILALEQMSEKVDRISSVYFNLFSSEADASMQALAQQISPLLSNFSSDISLDSTLFQKIKFIYDHRKDLNLVGEDLKLTEKMYKDFSRNGALLSDKDKESLRKIDQELSVLSPQFSENVLKATNAYELWIDNKEDLKGLPEGAIEAAAMSAEQKGNVGKWLFTLQAPSLIPFLTYADSRPLREKIWRANASKAFGGEYDNQEIILKIIKLKYDRAILLGFKNHADYVLQERMAEKPEAVFNFLNKILEPSKKAAEKDLAEVRSFKKELERNDDIKPWDFAYYSEKLKEKKYAFNEEELRPYFKLENVIEGVFKHAEQLYGLKFIASNEYSTYHPDVKTFEVYDHSHGKNNTPENYIGVFYMDFFPRETKKGGAWMTSYREQGLWGKDIKRPHVSIVCNFTKPTPTKPSLLDYNEVTTLFHEFGHALHGLLSKCKYRSLSGTNVYWDFVELPSQIMENWAREKEGLDLFAKHYETQEPLPAELIAKIKKAEQFQSGWMSLRQVSFGLLDMKWYTTPPSQITDVDEFETQAAAATRIIPKEPNTNMSCSFSHIFAGGYSAGYYSYKWAEVLDADAFEYFKQEGLFNKAVASQFKNSILSRGGTEHPMKLYIDFRGREPDAESLLRRDGLL